MNRKSSFQFQPFEEYELLDELETGELEYLDRETSYELMGEVNPGNIGTIPRPGLRRLPTTRIPRPNINRPQPSVSSSRLPGSTPNTSRTGQSGGPTFTRNDVIDQRIDVFAQYSLLRMFKGDAAARGDGEGMLAAVKTGQLAGIYKEDERVPAMRAKSVNLGWWQLIPKGEDSALVDDPKDPRNGAPIIVFRDSVRSTPTRIDPALRKAWRSFLLRKTGPASELEYFDRETSYELMSEVSRSSSAYVQWIQQSLNKILSLRLAVDGISGPQTRSAIRSFQQRQRLVVDGIVGPKTEAGLVAAGAVTPPGGGTPPGPTPAGVDFVIKIVAKSFINLIRLATGATICNPLIDTRLRALALATDAAFHENPLTDVKDKVYRLYSERTFRVTCQDGRIVKAVPSPLDTDVGLECDPITSLCLTPPAITTSGISAGSSGPNSFDFSWMAKGRPHPFAEPAFQLVCPRVSFFIWHRVSGRLECVPTGVKVAVSLSGSHFPSHRIWSNNRALISIPQGNFSRLWVPNTSDFTLVA